MKQRTIQTIFLVLLVGAALIIGKLRSGAPEAAHDAPVVAPSSDRPTPQRSAPDVAPPVQRDVPVRAAPQDRPQVVRSDIGFRSRTQFLDHFEKHGREFGAKSADEYLRLAQSLRDAPRGGDVLEMVRATDGVVTRFDKRTGAFLAFNADRTIRTFFRPNDGEAYFRRQLDRPEDAR